jgi:hypothetical protein
LEGQAGLRLHRVEELADPHVLLQVRPLGRRDCAGVVLLEELADTVGCSVVEPDRQHGASELLGTISEDGKVVANAGEWFDPMTGERSKLRSVTTMLEPDRYTLEWFMTGEDGKEDKRVTLTHTRRKPRAE